MRKYFNSLVILLATISMSYAGVKSPGVVGGNVSGTASISSVSQAAGTSADGFSLIDPTAASSGNQQWSPRLRFTGQGWGTTASSSQEGDWIIENQMVQGTVPVSNLVFSAQINGGGYTQVLKITSSVGGNSVWSGSLAITGSTLAQGALTESFGAESVGSVYTIASGTGACATTSTKVGGSMAGNFTCTGTTGASTVTLTLNAQGSTGVACFGRDVTTPTTVTQTGAISLTSVTLTLTSVSANDVIQFACPLSY